MNVLVAVVPDKRRQLKNETYPLKLRLTYNRVRRYYSLSHERRQGLTFNVTDKEWEKIKSDSPRGRYRDIQIIKEEITKEAEGILKSIHPFTFQAFEKAFTETNTEHNLFSLFEDYIKELKTQGRISTASSYQCSLNSIKAYNNISDFHNITPDYLMKYENTMVANGMSISTVGIYLRSLRSIFNIARKKKITNYYPFSDYVIPTGLNTKKALEISDIKKLMNFNAVELSSEDRARDLWMLSYFSNGMNIKDICNLKIENINLQTKEISYIRQKTKRARRQTKIEVDLIPETIKIIKKWGKVKGKPDDYVFPFFYNGITPERQRDITQNVVKVTNKHINSICNKVGIKIKVGTYHARHSFANILKQSGASTEFISESLGHSDLNVTSNYLKSFSSQHRKKWKKSLNPNAKK